jgi:hypothetical protein
MSSCVKEDQNVYSKEPKIDNWVKENRETFTDIKLSEISKNIGEKQRAIFRIINSENKKNLWIEKFKIMKEVYSNQGEIFDEVLNFVELHNFDNGLNQNDIAFFNKIIEKGRTKFSWTDEFIGITFCSFEFYQPGYSYMIFADSNYIAAPDDPAVGETTCNCKWGGMFACGSMDCNKGCKDDGKKGCGFLFMETCTGKCE